MNKVLLYILIILFIFINNSNSTFLGDCMYMKNQIQSSPLSIYISSYKYSNKNSRIDYINIINNSKSQPIFQTNTYDLHEIEFVTISSNKSILVKANDDYFNELLSGDNSTQSLSIKWDFKLLQPYYTIDKCYDGNNVKDYLLDGVLTAMVLNGQGNFTILSGRLISNEIQYEYPTKFKSDLSEFKYFKSSFDVVNNIHFSLISNNNKYYLVITNLNNSTQSINEINLPNMDIKLMGISAFNNTIVINNYDKLLNSTILYKFINLNNYSDEITILNYTNVIFNRVGFKSSNFIRSLNSNYLILYSNTSKQIIVYNISTNETTDYSNIQIDIPMEFTVIDLISTFSNSSVLKSKITNSNGNGDESGNEIDREKKKIIVASIVTVVGAIIIISVAIIFFIKKRNRSGFNGGKSFKKLDKDKEIHHHHQHNSSNNNPEDNVTILLENYK